MTEGEIYLNEEEYLAKIVRMKFTKNRVLCTLKNLFIRMKKMILMNSYIL